MNKKQQIELFLSQPIKVGDVIRFTGDGNGSQDKTRGCYGEVTKVEGDTISFLNYYRREDTRPISEVTKVTDHIGANPFTDWKRVDFQKSEIRSLLHTIGHNENGEQVPSRYIKGSQTCSFDPFVTLEDGTDFYYQRGLEWTEEQNQLLIDSIYLGIDIGKFSFRSRSFEYVEKRINAGLPASFFDLIDGKQRINAIIEFLGNKFPDNYGNYWTELSGKAQTRFLCYSNVQKCELGENTTDKETLTQFLMVNHSGKPMSKEHIANVQAIVQKLKE